MSSHSERIITINRHTMSRSISNVSFLSSILVIYVIFSISYLLSSPAKKATVKIMKNKSQ